MMEEVLEQLKRIADALEARNAQHEQEVELAQALGRDHSNLMLAEYKASLRDQSNRAIESRDSVISGREYIHVHGQMDSGRKCHGMLYFEEDEGI
jgi:hypothetical protein